MKLTRREFTKQLGIALASLLVNGCNPLGKTPTPEVVQVACYEPIVTVRRPDPTRDPGAWS